MRRNPSMKTIKTMGIYLIEAVLRVFSSMFAVYALSRNNWLGIILGTIAFLLSYDVTTIVVLKLKGITRRKTKYSLRESIPCRLIFLALCFVCAYYSEVASASFGNVLRVGAYAMYHLGFGVVQNIVERRNVTRSYS